MGSKDTQGLRKRAYKSRKGVTLVGPLKLRSGLVICPLCNETTRAHVLVAAAVLSSGRRVQGPALVSGVPELSEPVPQRLALMAPNFVLAGGLASREVAFVNHCQHCLGLLHDRDVLEGADSPFLLPDAEHPSDINLSGFDLVVPRATVRVRGPAS